MTTVLSHQVDGPALHAFMIGVGYYRHLPGGSGPVLANPLGLKQVPTPPLSVRAVLDWLTGDYSHPNSPPLGSVELLMSVNGRYAYKGRHVARATLPNAELAFHRWIQRCDNNPGNVALFFFCGHGLERDHHYLLLEDFGRAPQNPMSASIDLNGFHEGMTACRADVQLFIADACRQVPWDLIKTYGGLGNPLKPPSYSGRNTDRSASILSAAGEGRSAFGDHGQVTHFTQAFLRALRGAGASEDQQGSDEWLVRYNALVTAINRILRDDPPGGIQRQECSSDGPTRDVILARLSGPPLLTVRVDCLPPETADFAILKLSSQLRDVTRSRQPCPGPWREEELPADYAYRLTAEYADERYPAWSRDVPVVPPLPRLPARVTP
ncbi:caspase family protein [Streptomyces virginiae]|uniref:caspase family protein n=1 Tax=Streptomyces virginiae TaxID=1961 RepID=UPI0036257B0C